MRRGLPAVVCAVAALGGCGGEVAGVREAPAPLEAVADRSLPEVEAPKASRAEEAAIQRALDRDRAARRRRAAAADRRQARADRRRLARERERTADRVATGILNAAGFEASAVTVSGGGREVELEVTRDAACATPAGADERALRKQLRAALPFLRAVSVSVQGGDASLAQVRAACGPELEAQEGEVFLLESGTGAFRSGLLDVTAKRWSIDYASDGSFIDIVVLRDGRVLRSSIRGTAGATGTRTFDGVGTFRVRVAGDGRWAVRLRAG